MHVLLTGSREWTDYRMVRVVLLGIMHAYETPLIIGEGCARGLDELAERFCKEFKVENHHFPAQWRDHGDGFFCRPKCISNPSTCYGAGPRRNKQMLEAMPWSVVIGFKDGLDLKSGRGGTEDMLARAENAGIPTFHIDHGPSALRQGVLL